MVFRGNRDNDFRASGSGKLNFETELPKGLLDYAKNILVAIRNVGPTITISFPTIFIRASLAV